MTNNNKNCIDCYISSWGQRMLSYFGFSYSFTNFASDYQVLKSGSEKRVSRENKPTTKSRKKKHSTSKFEV